MINNEILKDKLLRDIINEDINKSIESIPQANWNQNDETAPDYIKNRTHYEKENRTSIYEKAKVLGGILTNQQNIGVSPSLFTVGETYIVTVDGVEYTGVCEYQEDPYDGSAGTQLLYSDVFPNFYEGVPVNFSTYNHGLYVSFDDVESIPGSTPHSLKIEHLGKAVIPLDEKFIPDTIARTTLATETASGLMSAEDKAKINKMPSIKMHDWMEV